MIKPKITFVMMAFNAEKTIAQAIESVLKQTEPNVVLFVRNNGSTDRTGEIIKEYQKKDSRIYTRENKYNQIPDDGSTYCMLDWWLPEDVPVGEYVSFLDSDDYLALNFSETLLAAAEENNAELVVGGCYFLENGQIIGTRVPPYLKTNTMADIGPVFPVLYQNLRTWWGKLYRSDFFIEHAAYAWGKLPPLYYVVDTMMVLRYLGKASTIACTPDPLYYFRSSDTSTYSVRYMDCFRIWEADALFEHGKEVLENFGIETEQNINFLYNCHIGYLSEALECMIKNKINTLQTMLPLVEDVLNNSIVGVYCHESFETLFFIVRKYVNYVMEQKNDYPSLWDSYLVRLHYVMVQREKGESSILDFPVLISALCDKNNRNKFGKGLLECGFSKLSKEEALFLKQTESEKLWQLDHPDYLLYFLYQNGYTKEVSEKERCLKTFWEDRQYGDALACIKEISEAFPFSREAMYYRLCAAYLMQEKAFAMQMSFVARTIFDRDWEMQELCYTIENEYIKKGGGGQK